MKDRAILPWEEIPDFEASTVPGQGKWVLRKMGGPTLTCAMYEPAWVEAYEIREGEATYDDFMEAWDASIDIDAVDRVLTT